MGWKFWKRKKVKKDISTTVTITPKDKRTTVYKKDTSGTYKAQPTGATTVISGGGSSGGGSSGGGSSGGGSSGGSSTRQGPMPEGSTQMDVVMFNETGITPQTQQIQTAKTLTSVDSLSQRTKTQLSFWEATVATGKQFGGNIATIFSNKPIDFQTTNYYEYVGNQKADQTAYTDYSEGFGTLSTDPATGQTINAVGFKDVTYKDIQEKTEFDRSIEISGYEAGIQDKATVASRSFQKRINKGEDFETVKAESVQYFDTLNAEYRAGLQTISDKYPDVSDFTTRSGENIPRIAEGVLDVGVGLASIPVPVLGIAYFGGKGVAQASKVQSSDGMSAQGEIILTPEQKSLQTQAGLNLLTAATFGISSVFNIGGSITADRLATGRTLESFTKAKLFGGQTDDAVTVMTRSLKSTPGYEMTSKKTFVGTLNPDKTISISQGSGRTTERVLDFMKQGTGEYPWRTSMSTYTIQGAVIPQTSDDIAKFTGSVLMGTDDAVQSFRFGGATQTNGKFSFTKSGQPKFFKTDMVTGKKTILATVDDLAITQDARFGMDVIDDLGTTGYTKFQGGGSKSSSQYFDDLYGAVDDTVVPSTSKPTKFYSKHSKGGQVTVQEVKTDLQSLGSIGGLNLQTNLAVNGASSLMFAPAIANPGASVVNNMSRSRSKNKFSQGYQPAYDVTSAARSSVIPKTGVISKTSLKQTIKLIVSSGNFGAIPKAAPGYFTIPTVPIPNLSKPSFSLGKKGPAKKVGGFDISRAGSSYAAAVFDVRGKETKGSFGGMFSGLEIRPLTKTGEVRVRVGGKKAKVIPKTRKKKSKKGKK